MSSFPLSYIDEEGCTYLIHRKFNKFPNRDPFSRVSLSLLFLPRRVPLVWNLYRNWDILHHTHDVVLLKLRFRRVYFRNLRWIGERRSSSGSVPVRVLRGLHMRQSPTRVLIRPGGCKGYMTSSTTFTGTFLAQRTTPEVCHR